MTIRERFGGLDGRPHRLPRRRQQRLPLADADRRRGSGCAFAAACPPGYEPMPAIVDVAPGGCGRERRLASRSSTTRARRAAGADVLYTDVWTSMGQEDERERRLRDLEPFRLDDEKLDARGARTRSRCTACRRTSARRSPRTCSTGHRSLVWDQAENRLHVYKAVLALTVR